MTVIKQEGQCLGDKHLGEEFGKVLKLLISKDHLSVIKNKKIKETLTGGEDLLATLTLIILNL